VDQIIDLKGKVIGEINPITCLDRPWGFQEVEARRENKIESLIYLYFYVDERQIPDFSAKKLRDYLKRKLVIVVVGMAAEA
jgi:hypothetical protein